MTKEFHQVEWDHSVEQDLRDLIGRMLEEDLASEGDCTSLALIPEDAPGRAAVVVRENGVVAGLRAPRSCLPKWTLL